MKYFKFLLNERVEIEVSAERGQVIARADYASAENSYLVRDRAASGKTTETWWTESALIACAPTL